MKTAVLLRKTPGLLLFWGVAALTVSAATAADFYVSPSGSDDHPGTQEKPFATLQAAVNRLQPGDTLWIRGGVYRETVVFPAGGTAEKPVTVKACRGERVVISGCEPIAGWTVHDKAKNIWKAPMPWTLGTGRNQVFCDGRVMIEARHPNEPAPGLEMFVSDLSPLWPTFGEFSISDPAKNPGRVVSKLLDGDPPDHWKGALYYGVHFQGWSAQTGVIERSEPGAIHVGDRTNQWWFAPADSHWLKNEEGRGMIVGHINALDRPGEWHWQDGILYLIPPSGAEPRNVEAKRRQVALDLSGREHIRIEGIAVEAASARLEDSAHCVFDRCRFDYVSHFTRLYSIGQVERGRDTIKSGETGLFVSGRDNAFSSCAIRFSAGAGIHLRGYHHTIHNCLIDEVCYTAHYFNTITDAVSDFADYEDFRVGGHVITYNTLRNSGRHFFNIYGNGTSTASRDRGPMDYMATLFAHNHLYNGMLLTRDAGFITGYYGSGGTLNGLRTRIAYNVMHDNYDLFGMRINALGMVYLDAGTCDVELDHNLLWAAPGSHQRAMWFNSCCADVREHDNVFHPRFTGTSATLKPADFPQGKPFRFGHDFDNPPPVADWPPLKTQRLDIKAASSQAGDPGRLKDGDWFAFDAVKFDDGWQSAVVRFAGDVKAINSDRAARAKPRHRKATDPLVLEAVTNDGRHEQIKTQWTFIHNVSDGCWLRFNQVPLGEGYRRFRVVYGNTSPEPRWLEVRLDSVDGPPAGRVDLPQTDVPRQRGPADKPTTSYIQIYGEAVGEISESAAGTRDVFVVFRSADGRPVGEFEYFRFEQYRGTIPLQKDEVKLELRAGGKDGAKLGEFHPRFTGGAGKFREFVTPLEPARGTQPLFLVVRSALPGPVGAVESLDLQRADGSAVLRGIGNPPLVRGGEMVLPQPTHPPRARPADKYEKPAP
ncbi:MAG: carbohydrate-binding protein [Thermogutta sp.]|nr:carbohydrate-binding protein [Thermogutta sp.]